MAEIHRDTVVKFCNLTGENSNQNGKYGLYRKKLGDEGRHRIMQTSGYDRAVNRENFEVYELDLNQEITNGVVLVFPPSTGKTGTKPVAVPLPDFPHEVSANGMTPFEWWDDLKLPYEFHTERMTGADVLLNRREMQILKEYFDQVDGVDFEDFMKDDENAVFNGPNGKRDYKNMKRFIRTRYNNMLRQQYCADNFGWKKPARMQICNGPNEYAAQIPEVVYWHDVAEKKGIENTFMRLAREKGDSFIGAVVFDFSYKKLRPEEAEKHKMRAHPEHPEHKYLIHMMDNMDPDFERVKTLGDIQDYIVKISVDYGSHPSNPWMNEAIDNGFLGGREMTDNCGEILKNIALIQENDPDAWAQIMKIAEKKKSDGENGVFMKKAERCDALKKGRESAEDAVQKSEADEKKQRLKDKIREKRLKRQGK